MPLKWSIRIPSHASSAISRKLKPAVEKATKMAMPRVAALIIDHASSEADRRLNTMAAEFKAALHQPDAITVTDTGIEIRLTTQLARSLELGGSSFDIKAKMLTHAKHFSKDGAPYIDVPFQHAASAGASRMSALPPAVRAAMTHAVATAKATAIKAGASKSEAAAQTVRLKQRTPGKVFERTLVVGGKTLTTRVAHKRGIHDDLIRTAVAGAGRAVTKHSTIRRISSKSSPTSWWHPGFKGVGIFKAVMPQVRKDVEAIIRDSFKSVGLAVRFK